MQQISDGCFEFDEDLQLSEKMTYAKLGKAVRRSKAHVPSGSKLLKSGQCVSRLTVAPNEKKGFAVILSISHVVADGATYYRVLKAADTVEASDESDVINRVGRRGRSVGPGYN